jgi:hypothetical protein
MADDLSGNLDDATKRAAGLANELERAEKASAGVNTNVKGTTGGAGGSTQAANFSSSAGGTFGSSTGGPFTAPQAQNNTSFSGYQGSQMMGALKAIGTTMLGAAAFLPTTQEALSTQQIAERMRFYSGGSNNTKAQYGIMNKAMSMGTAVSPGDILQAVNAGAGAGLTTGLKNYNAGAGFSGILGGAALASNLAPGIGLTGGMGVMANINQAQSVNMLKMLGIQVRGNDGRTMNDLPQIIDQLFGILTKNGPVSPEDIAVSLMSGNALDSLLNQYFGSDANTRTTVIAGLMQRLKSGKKLRESGSKGALTKTGGTTAGVSSAAYRNMAEQQLIESYSDVTNEAAIFSNNMLQGLYGGLANPTAPGARTTLEGVQKASVGLSSFSGARGGAGGAVLGNLVDSGSSLLKGLKTSSTAAKGGIIAGVAGAIGLSKYVENVNGNGVSTPATMYDVAPGSAQSTTAPQFTGAVTINVSAPPGSDPYAYSAAFLDAMR